MKDQEVLQTASVLLESVNALTAAIILLANKTGNQADGVATTDTLTVEVKPEAKPEEKQEDQEEKKIGFLDIKEAFQKFAMDNGRATAMELLSVYTGKGKISAVKENDYKEFMEAVNGPQ